MEIDNNRTFERFPIARLTFVSSEDGKEAHGGVLANISGGGAMVELAEPMRTITHHFEAGMPVNVTIDEFPPLKGTVVRTTEAEICVAFTLDNDEQVLLKDEILAVIEAQPDRINA